MKPDLPVVTVGAMVERADGRILVVRTHKWRGRFGLPGGKVERGEPLEEALGREIREETGLSIRDIRFVAAQDSIDAPEFHRLGHMVLLNYHCRTDEVDVRLNEEAQSFLWVTPAEALSLDLNAPTRSLVDRWLATLPGKHTAGCDDGTGPLPSEAGALLLTPPVCEELMREALAEARRGLDEGECPVGCVVARMGGAAPRIVARGHNRVEAMARETAHAEMLAFENAEERLAAAASDIALVSTLEPCVMCLGACFEVGVALVVFGLPAPADGGIGRIKRPSSPGARTPALQGDVLAAESRALFGEFVRRRGSGSAPYAEQLLSLTVA
jgi:tRNA(Arg) A34 adenosine deaminase TadA/ADP-ribose pyrophosphatase YjhB (NUDIX family)